MKFSTLLKRLYEESEFTSQNSLSEVAGVTLGFTERTMKGENTTVRIDALFDALTLNLNEEDFLLAVKLISEIKGRIVKEQQIL